MLFWIQFRRSTSLCKVLTKPKALVPAEELVSKLIRYQDKNGTIFRPNYLCAKSNLSR